MTINAEARTKLTKARIDLIIQQPFFGTLALRLQLIENNTIPTLAVDGKRVYYNAEFINDLTFDLTKSALAHEIGHCIFEHIGRRGARDPMKWNMAGDYVINDVIKDAGFSLGEGWLHNSAFKGMTSDHIYNLLPDMPGGGPGIGKPGGALCDIMDGTSDTGEPMSQQDAMEWKIATVQAANAAKAQGKLPGSLQRFVDEIVNGKADWRAILRRFVTEISKADYSWQRFNRRYMANGIYLPSLYSESMGPIVIVTDDSGSIDGPILNAFEAEIRAIRDATMPEKTHHISCDSRINHTDEFEQDDDFKLVSKGGGGTDFRPPFDYVAEHGLAPACLIYLTDLYGPAPEAPPEYPVLWCCTTDQVGPWGETVKIEI